MEKVFISTVPMQFKSDLKKVLYHPDGFALESNRETCFPIIPIIEENKKDEIPVKVIAIALENGDVKVNYGKFLQELAEIGVGEERVIRISLEEEISKKTQIELMTGLLHAIPDDSMVYCDVTYGMKPTSVINTFMMIYLPLLKPNCTIQGLYYGQLPRVNREGILEKAMLCNLTEYVYMGEIVQQLYNMDVSDPEGFFLKLINE